MSIPKVSVIIPCFNLGRYIHEALDSVLSQTFQNFEIIVVNDGSTDEETNHILNSLNISKLRVINTENRGLAEARNNGISSAAGNYILPLDADDKIASTYLERAVKILDQNENMGIVYCQAEFFGEENFKWDLPDFELSRMLIDNLIFCSAFFRKHDWNSVGGYKANMIYGWEDYDFWLSIIELKREVYRIPEYLFYYRKRKDSMANSMSRENTFYSYKEIVKNHGDLFIDNVENVFKYIYSLRDNIEELREQQILKDTKIHNLNIEIQNLNKEIHNLNEKNTILNLQISNWRWLTKQLFKSLIETVKKSFGLKNE